MSKGEFAAELGVSAARISQYIKEGKIDGDALVGDGRTARIKADVARAQLSSRLDVSQMTGNGLKTRIGHTPAPSPAAPLSTADPFEAQMRNEKLEQAKIQTRKMRAEEMARAGRYVLASDAESAMAKLASRIMTVFDGGLQDIAAAIAERFEVPVRDVTHELQKQVKEMRKRQSAAAAEHLGAVPQMVSDEADEVAEA